jgi:hypothetical protein
MRYASNIFTGLAIAGLAFGLFWALAGQVFVDTQDAFSVVLGLSWALAVLFAFVAAVTA